MLSKHTVDLNLIRTSKSPQTPPKINTSVFLYKKKKASTVKPKALDYDPEYAKFREAVGPQNLRVPIFETALEFRDFNDSFMPALWARLPA